MSSHPTSIVPSDVPVGLQLIFCAVPTPSHYAMPPCDPHGLHASQSPDNLCIPSDTNLFSVKQSVCRCPVMDVGRCCRQAMHQTSLIIHTDGQLHAQVPLLPFSALLHPGITLPAAVLPRCRCCNDPGIQYLPPLLEHQTLIRQILSDRLKQHLVHGAPVDGGSSESSSRPAPSPAGYR